MGWTRIPCIRHGATTTGSAVRTTSPDEEQRVRTAFEGEDFKLRSEQEVAALSVGLELVDPGVVPTQRWRPAPGETVPDDHELGMYAFIARKLG